MKSENHHMDQGKKNLQFIHIKLYKSSTKSRICPNVKSVQLTMSFFNFFFSFLLSSCETPTWCGHHEMVNPESKLVSHIFSMPWLVSHQLEVCFHLQKREKSSVQNNLHEHLQHSLDCFNIASQQHFSSDTISLFPLLKEPLPTCIRQLLKLGSSNP